MILRALAFAAVAAISANAAERTAEERGCAANVYCAEEMVCVRTVADPKPRGMSPDFYSSIVAIKTFKSTRRNQTLATSLQVTDDPTGAVAPTLEAAVARAEFSDYGIYGSPILFSGPGPIAFLPWGPSTNFSTGVHFKVISSEERDGYRLDRLTGEEKVVGDVVSDYSAKYECQAKVVPALSRVDDFTAGRR